MDTSANRPGFEPAATAGAGRSATLIWSVSGLLLAASDAIQARLGAVAVRGELSGLVRAASGHCYFTLKDSDGQAAMLRCAMFRRAAALLDFRPEDGQQVELRGRISIYEARGELQMVVEGMQRLGAGSLYELFVRLRAKLAAAGLFEATRKRPLPAFARAVGVVTSRDAAALRDVLSALARRAPQVRVVVYPSAVQGADAPAQLVRAIALANRRCEVDVLIVCRGGGSLEDLWSFNDEQVVRAVAASALPVVCGVGHETDVTLAELAADLRAATPTAAAELVAPHRDGLLAQLDGLAATLRRAARWRLDQQLQRLDRLAMQAGRPTRRVAAEVNRLDRLAQRQHQAVRNLLQRHQRRHAERLQQLSRVAASQLLQHGHGLDRLALRLQAVDPQRVLARGYALLSDGAGRTVVQAAQLSAGQGLTARWADGAAEVQVQSVRLLGPADAGTARAPAPPVPPAAAPPRARQRRKPAP